MSPEMRELLQSSFCVSFAVLSGNAEPSCKNVFYISHQHIDHGICIA